MRLLLDTNILVPIAADPVSVFGEKIDTLLDAPDAALFFSVASLWEIAIKSRLGKLPLAVPLDAVPALLTSMGLSLLDVRAAHALAQVEPVPDTSDPFDRLLLGICVVEDLRLVTTDRALQEHPLAWRAVD